MKISIFVTNKCNFLCEHCATAYADCADFSDIDMDIIINNLDEQQQYNICFTGGEPTILIEQIVKFQQRCLNYNMNYSMITNGSWWQKYEEIFNKIILHKIIFSWDIYHAKHISADAIIFLIKEAKFRNIFTKVNIGLTSILDIITLPAFKDADKRTYFKMFLIGRALNNNKLEIKNKFNTCSVHNKNNVYYFSSKGFSLCCSYLSLHKSNVNIFYTSLNNKNKIYDLLMLPISEQYKLANKKKVFAEYDICYKCFFLYNDI